MGFTTRRRVSIPPPLISQIASVFRNHEASPPNQEALIGATARLMRRGAAYQSLTRWTYPHLLHR